MPGPLLLMGARRERSPSVLRVLEGQVEHQSEPVQQRLCGRKSGSAVACMMVDDCAVHYFSTFGPPRQNCACTTRHSMFEFSIEGCIEVAGHAAPIDLERRSGVVRKELSRRSSFWRRPMGLR